jgi:addiction module HigA family antidote
MTFHYGGRPIHPGEFLREDYMAPLNMSVSALARALSVPVTRLHEITKERRGITADTALRLARYWGTTPDYWLGLQQQYDLRVAELESAKAIKRYVTPREAVAV